tara:strand:+ start:686 stop:1324 length:639 start_codon:yes stop_codon:yes gene_type:complete
MIKSLVRKIKGLIFSFSSSRYWEKRYLKGGDSGYGSYGYLAEYKAEIINNFINNNSINTVIEFGSGDGNQLKYMNYKNYIGFDVSNYIIRKCRNKYKDDSTKQFNLYSNYNNEISELTLSLDVIFHLIEEDIFIDYMKKLFNASNKYVIIYSSNTNNQLTHMVKHFRNRKFTDWIEANQPDFKLIKFIKNDFPYEKLKEKGSVSDFYIYQNL